MYLTIWLLNGMRKGSEQVSGSEDVRGLENVTGMMPSVPLAPKRSRNCAQHGRAAGRGSENVEHWRTSGARA